MDKNQTFKEFIVNQSPEVSLYGLLLI